MLETQLKDTEIIAWDVCFDVTEELVQFTTESQQNETDTIFSSQSRNTEQ